MFLLLVFIAHSSFSQDAKIPSEIEDPKCLGINKEPYHATLMSYANLQEALLANRHASSLCRSLNGYWKFHLYPEAFFNRDKKVNLKHIYN